VVGAIGGNLGGGLLEAIPDVTSLVRPLRASGLATAGPRIRSRLDHGKPGRVDPEDARAGFAPAVGPEGSNHLTSTPTEAVAAILFGDVNPSARLPITFAKTEADLPHPQVPGIDLKPANRPPPFDVNNAEGLKVGYKWFEAEHRQPLFPFGYGLSYTTFAYSALKADGNTRTVSFSVKNTGRQAGAEVAQVYVMLPSAAGEPFKRLAAWERVPLQAWRIEDGHPAAGPALPFNLQCGKGRLGTVGPLSSAFHIGE